MTLNFVPTERSCDKVILLKYEGPKSYQSKDMAYLEVFADGQTEVMAQKLYTPDLSIRGHKKKL